MRAPGLPLRLPPALALAVVRLLDLEPGERAPSEVIQERPALSYVRSRSGCQTALQAARKRTTCGFVTPRRATLG